MTAPSPQAMGPITVPNVWNLHADPAALEAAAEVWRRLESGAREADDTVRDASGRVLTEGTWTGDAADSYGTHRSRLVRALDRLGDLSAGAAESLDAAAYVLRTGQSQLDGQLQALTAAVPATRSGKDLSFQPVDQAQADQVRQAVGAAREVRDWVDERLAAWAGKLRDVEDGLGSLGEQWVPQQAEPRSIRLMDLNMGRGKDNTPWGEHRGVDDGERDDIVQMIIDNDADVVTLQEVFGTDVSPVFGMVAALEQQTGDHWEVVFSEADQKFNAHDWGNLAEEVLAGGSDADPFGNAILVRHRDGIEGVTPIADEQLQEPGNLGAFNQGEEGRAIGGVRIDLAEPD